MVLLSVSLLRESIPFKRYIYYVPLVNGTPGFLELRQRTLPYPCKKYSLKTTHINLSTFNLEVT